MSPQKNASEKVNELPVSMQLELYTKYKEYRGRVR